MLLSVTVALWFLCGLAAIYLAFSTARRYQEDFDPIHIWLAVLGPLGLILACLTLLGRNRDETPSLRWRVVPKHDH